jgi:phospholipase C
VAPADNDRRQGPIRLDCRSSRQFGIHREEIPVSGTSSPSRRTVLSTALAAALGLGVSALLAPTGAAATTPPRFDHVVVVMEENHAFNEIIGSSSAPYINSLGPQGAVFTNSFAIEHPSQPNYLDLFSGGNQGVTSDSCPHTFTANNLGNELRTSGLSYAGYSEGLPSDGSTVCTSGEYARKHNPSSNFSDLPATTNLTFADFPDATNFASLPTVSFVDPNLLDDMHDGTIAAGDTWLRDNIDAYAQWAKTHNSLLVVTWDEDDSSQSNQIPTLFVGANVTPGNYAERIDHFSVLRTIEDAYGLGDLGGSATATPITDVFGA